MAPGMAPRLVSCCDEDSQEQPYIFRPTWLGVETELRGRRLQLAAEVSRLIFGGTKDWRLGDKLSNVAARAGLDLDQKGLPL